MEAYIGGDSETGDAKMKETKPLYKKSLSHCGEIADHIDDWAKKTDDMLAREDWP